LLDQCRKQNVNLDEFEEVCRQLTRYAVEFRYPEEDELTEVEGRAAFDAARRIVESIVSLL
jgi:hypothetical protein